jgi:hypothetical protein
MVLHDSTDVLSQHSLEYSVVRLLQRVFPRYHEVFLKFGESPLLEHFQGQFLIELVEDLLLPRDKLGYFFVFAGTFELRPELNVLDFPLFD